MIRIVIAVVGGAEQPEFCKALGAAIAKAGHILLTGGSDAYPQTKADEAKNAAIQGAINEAKAIPQTTARLIGILPSTGNPAWKKPSTPPPRNVKSMFLKTGMKSEERDVINGYTPDVMIAVRGGAGTLLEIGYACANKIPVLFFCSAEHLRRRLTKPELHEKNPNFAVGVAKYSSLNLNQGTLLQGLTNLLNTARDTPAADAAGAVKAACAATKQGTGTFPGIPGYSAFKTDFAQKMAAL